MRLQGPREASAAASPIKWWAWRVRLSEGAFPDGDVVPGDYGSMGALLARWREEERPLRIWVAGLSDEALGAPPPGQDSRLATWRYLLYVVNHGLQQLAEAAVLLSQRGHSPGEIGYLAFCADQLEVSGGEEG